MYCRLVLRGCNIQYKNIFSTRRKELSKRQWLHLDPLNHNQIKMLKQPSQGFMMVHMKICQTKTKHFASAIKDCF